MDISAPEQKFTITDKHLVLLFRSMYLFRRKIYIANENPGTSKGNYL